MRLAKVGFIDLNEDGPGESGRGPGRKGPRPSRWPFPSALPGQLEEARDDQRKEGGRCHDVRDWSSNSEEKEARVKLLATEQKIFRFDEKVEGGSKTCA